MEKSKQLLLVENQVIETGRLLLRPVQLTDAADMYEYASDDETIRYVFPKNENFEATQENIAKFFLADPIGKYGIVLKENQKFLGTIDIRVDEVNKKAEIGYTINKKYWSKGIMTEAAQALVRLGFEVLDLERIFAMHDERNVASGRVMQKIGMQKEGILRHARIHNAEFVNDVYYSILKSEYFGN